MCVALEATWILENNSGDKPKTKGIKKAGLLNPALG